MISQDSRVLAIAYLWGAMPSRLAQLWGVGRLRPTR